MKVFKFSAYNPNENNIDAVDNIFINKHIHKEKEEEHTHEFIEISYIFSGEGYQVINDKSFYVKRGDLLFLNFCDWHSFTPIRHLGVLNCLVKPEFISNELVNSHNALDILTLTSFRSFCNNTGSFKPIINFSGKELVEVESILDGMVEEYTRKEYGYTTLLKGYLDVLLVKIFRWLNISDDSPFNTNTLHKITPEVISFIEKNYNRKISLEELAKFSFYNPTYFCTVFKECMGVTLSQFINEKRVNSAMEYLRESDLCIEKIMHMVGFNNKNQFYKVFKEHTGNTPSEYRNKIQQLKAAN